MNIREIEVELITYNSDLFNLIIGRNMRKFVSKDVEVRTLADGNVYYYIPRLDYRKIHPILERTQLPCWVLRDGEVIAMYPMPNSAYARN